MKKLNIIFLPALFLLLFTACKKTNVCTGDPSAPGPVTNARVENLPGAARITYTLPDNPNLLYVEAKWEVNGVKKNAKSTLYQNNVLLEGFGDVEEYDVKLYAVSRCDVASEPVATKIKPLSPPIEGVYTSLAAVETFGGLNVAYTNPSRANIVIGILVKDSTGAWQHVDFHYSSQAANNFNVRGFAQNPPPQTQKQYTFGIYIKDRWDNHTDTLVKVLTPIYEEMVDKTKFRDIRSLNYPIPQIAPLPTSGGAIVNGVDYSTNYPLRNLWDGSVSSMFHTKEKVDQPLWIPIDLDQTGTVKYKLSRFKIWQRTGTFTFNHGNPHKWEIWGTNTPTIVSSWIKLGEWIMTKPSGRVVGDNSNEDSQVAADGQEFDFPVGLPATRYIGWKNVDSWGSIDGATGFMHLMELTLWGQKQ